MYPTYAVRFTLTSRQVFTFSWSSAYTPRKGWSLWIVSTAVAPFPSATARTNSWRVCGTQIAAAGAKATSDRTSAMAARFVFTRPEHRSPTNESQGPAEPVIRRFSNLENSAGRPVEISSTPCSATAKAVRDFADGLGVGFNPQ